MKTILYIPQKPATIPPSFRLFPMKYFYIILALTLSSAAYSADARPYRIHKHNRPNVDMSLQRASEGGIPTVTVAQVETTSTAANSDQTLTRGAFVKMVTERVYAKDVSTACFKSLSNSKYTHLFADVSLTSDLATNVCVGLDTGLLDVKHDNLFHADAPVNIAEASKVLSKAYNAGHLNRTVPAHMSWHQLYEDDLRRRGAIPEKAAQASYLITKDDALWMMEKLEPLRKELLAQQKATLRPLQSPMPPVLKPE